MRTTDTLARRIRFAPPQPFGKRIALNENDLRIFEAIHRHGHLPSHYLVEFTDKKNYNTHQQRLTKLFNGTETVKYLTRPKEQFESFFARYQHIVYDLDKAAIEYLKGKGKHSPYVKRGDSFVHRLMGACVGASIELACKKKGLGFIPRHDILKRNDKHLRLPLSKFANHSALAPDELFGIDYGGSYLFFACEWDRSTEPLKRKNTFLTDFEQKIKAYLEVLQEKTYRSEWGIPRMMVIVVTTNETRAQSMREAVLALDAKLAHRFIFKVIPTFGNPWRMPPVLEDILEPWDSVRGKFDITKP